MKSYLFLFFVLAFLNKSMAQHSLGVNLGGNYSNYNLPNTVGATGADADLYGNQTALLGYQFGLKYQFLHSTNIFANVDFLFRRRATEIKDRYTIVNETYFDRYVSNGFYVPITIGYKFTVKGFHIMPMVGCHFDYLNQGVRETWKNSLGPGLYLNKDFIYTNLNRLTMGLTAGLELAYKHFFLNASYNHGLSSMSNDTSNPSIYNRFYSLNLGYKYSFSSEK
jgi:hypothetical protein